MGLGQLLLSLCGSKKRYQPLFEKLVKLGAMGLGYGAPMGSGEMEDTAFRNALADSKEDDLVVFDVGANRGNYSAMAFATLQGRRCTVHAFEPDAANAERLRTRFNGRTDFRLVNKALGDKPGTVTFYKHAHDWLSSLHHPEQHPSNYRPNEVAAVVEVEITTLDAYCAEAGVQRIDLLKVDTEGHDLYVLRGATGLLAGKRIRNLQFEFSEMNVAAHDHFFDFWTLLSPNYDLFRLCKDGFHRIERYDPLVHELYYPVNFFARAKA